MSTFSELALNEAIVEAVAKLGFETPTPIQAATIPELVEGTDIIGKARTGSGKTAAFGLPMLHHLAEGGKAPRGLVLAPTRELALQVTEAPAHLQRACRFGLSPSMAAPPTLHAEGPQQRSDHRRGHPRSRDRPYGSCTLDLSQIEMFVLDEADEMLRMGFIDEVERVFENLLDRQVALFSATMPDAIQRVTKRFMSKPTVIEVEATSLSVDHIEQFWIRSPARKKLDDLVRLLLVEPSGYTLIFCRTRRGCAEVADALTKRGVAADAIHGDLNQAARERVINRMRAKSLNVLVATDVAARGIYHLTRVINFDYPGSAETYTHRIGRMGVQA